MPNFTSLIIYSLTNWTRHEEKVPPRGNRDVVALLFKKQIHRITSKYVAMRAIVDITQDKRTSYRD